MDMDIYLAYYYHNSISYRRSIDCSFYRWRLIIKA